MNARSHGFGILTALGVFLVLALWVGSVPIEDAFVSYDYARHVAAGDGLVFNAGDAATEGYSSLLWVLICAAPAAAGFDIPSVAPYMSLFFGTLCVLILWNLLRRRSARTEYWLTTLLVFASSAPFVIASMTGSDASLLSALLLAGVWSMDRLAERPSGGRAAAVGVVVSLALLCRFEAIIVAAVAVIVLLRSYSGKSQSRRYGRGVAGGIVLATVVYHGWRVATFGQVLPDSLLLHIGLNTGVFESVFPYEIVPFGMYYLIVGIITAMAFRLSKSTPGERFGIAVALLLGIVYVFIQDPTPALSNHAALLALAVLPWPHAHLALMGQSAEPAHSPHRLGHVLLILALLLLGAWHTADNRVTVERMKESYSMALRPVGEWLATWRPNLALATDHPGVIEYHANSTILDLRKGSRLGSTESNRARALVAADPDVIVLRVRGRSNILYDRRAARFEQVLRSRYRTLGVVRTSWSHDRSVIVHVRRDIPRLSDEQRDSFTRLKVTPRAEEER
jgi:hypothetical protein